VIVTIYHGSSYDPLFRNVKQVAPNGRVALYSARPDAEKLFLMKFKGQDLPRDTDEEDITVLTQLFADIKSIDPEGVTFNWECCSHWSSCGYKMNDESVTMELAKLLIDKRSMVMFSDFALKALIKSWKPEFLGPCPFVQLGECSGTMNLKFSPSTLITSPSAQLQKVGELCENGTLEMHAISGTILYTVDRSKTDTTDYNVQVLTIIKSLDGVNMENYPNNYKWKIENETGLPSHVILKYPSGGLLLTSAGHWVELVKVDVSMETLLKVAQTNYGEKVMNEMKVNLSNVSGYQQTQMMNQYGQQFIQQSAPSQYTKNNYN